MTSCSSLFTAIVSNEPHDKKMSSPVAAALVLTEKQDVQTSCYALANISSICWEAYAAPSEIKVTALKYLIQPSSDRRWKQSFDKLEQIDDVPENNQVLKHNKSSRMKRFVGVGHNCSFPEATPIKVKEYFDKKRSQNLSISVWLIAAETRKVAPVGCEALKDDAL
jgi:hypothetical protein